MDILTQGVLGAVMAQTAAPKKHMGTAAIVGLFAGILADADILINSSTDPLLSLEFHRHFTHSVFFIPLGAMIAALIVWPLVKQREKFHQIYIFCLLGYMLSGFIDACTSYGTHLFWPISQQTVSFNIISIIDPIFTLILLLTLLLALKNKSHRAIMLGLVLASLYLFVGWIQLQRATEMSRQLAAHRHHQIERVMLKPTLGNLLLWRSIYQSDGRLYVDAMRPGLFTEPRIYPGESVQLFDPDKHLAAVPRTSVLYNDIRRFMRFSGNFVAILPQQPDFLVDVRYSMLANSVKPLWGLQMDVNNPQQHADYQVIRDTSKVTRERFISMLLGEHPDSFNAGE